MLSEMQNEKKGDFRRKVKETREKDWIIDALRARKFTGIESLEQGIDLIKFALKEKYDEEKY